MLNRAEFNLDAAIKRLSESVFSTVPNIKDILNGLNEIKMSEQELSPNARNAVEVTRKRLMEILLNDDNNEIFSKESDRLSLADIAYQTLLVLAKLAPINPTDPFSLENIADQDKIVTSEGFQFDINMLAEWLNTKKEYYNILTNRDFPMRDQVHIAEALHRRKFKPTDVQTSPSLISRTDDDLVIEPRHPISNDEISDAAERSTSQREQRPIEVLWAYDVMDGINIDITLDTMRDPTQLNVRLSSLFTLSEKNPNFSAIRKTISERFADNLSLLFGAEQEQAFKIAYHHNLFMSHRHLSGIRTLFNRVVESIPRRDTSSPTLIPTEAQTTLLAAITKLRSSFRRHGCPYLRGELIDTWSQALPINIQNSYGIKHSITYALTGSACVCMLELSELTNNQVKLKLSTGKAALDLLNFTFTKGDKRSRLLERELVEIGLIRGVPGFNPDDSMGFSLTGDPLYIQEWLPRIMDVIKKLEHPDVFGKHEEEILQLLQPLITSPSTAPRPSR